MLWNGPYSKRLFEAVSGVFDAKKGFYEGIYENGKGPIRTFTANNNGIVLECLLYKVQGKLLKFGASLAGSVGGKSGSAQHVPEDAANGSGSADHDTPS